MFRKPLLLFIGVPVAESLLLFRDGLTDDGINPLTELGTRESWVLPLPRPALVGAPPPPPRDMVREKSLLRPEASPFRSGGLLIATSIRLSPTSMLSVCSNACEADTSLVYSTYANPLDLPLRCTTRRTSLNSPYLPNISRKSDSLVSNGKFFTNSLFFSRTPTANLRPGLRAAFSGLHSEMNNGRLFILIRSMARAAWASLFLLNTTNAKPLLSPLKFLTSRTSSMTPADAKVSRIVSSPIAKSMFERNTVRSSLLGSCSATTPRSLSSSSSDFFVSPILVWPVVVSIG
uniref:Secreted protein n=1 Tax=Cacopsylla melanoneura TaxID=428564 RepID=A0A8D8RTX1_9HEMI